MTSKLFWFMTLSLFSMSFAQAGTFLCSEYKILKIRIDLEANKIVASHIDSDKKKIKDSAATGTYLRSNKDSTFYNLPFWQYEVDQDAMDSTIVIISKKLLSEGKGKVSMQSRYEGHPFERDLDCSRVGK